MITAAKFVRLLKAEVVDANIASYAELLASYDRSEVEDTYWVNLLALYDSLDERQRDALIATMRQVAIDTVSNVLGVIDGSSSLPEFDTELSFKPKGGEEEWSGEMQDEFLMLVEEEQH